MERYQRQTSLPEVGLNGQKKLAEARVLIVGLGGLGSPAAMYLAAAGVGCLGLMDGDVVEESNLQRQVLFGAHQLGRKKVECAGETLRLKNPELETVEWDEPLLPENIHRLVGFDVVVDATDNFAARYLLNDACVGMGIPLIHGSVEKFEGRITVLKGQPCFRCLYPEPPEPWEVPSCSEVGVMGVVPGLIGVLQASEVIKEILQYGRSLEGRLIRFDGRETQVTEMTLTSEEKCPVCRHPEGIESWIRETNYAAACASDWEVTPETLKSLLESEKCPEILDVRLPEEHGLVNIGGTLLPLHELPEKVDQIRKDRPWIVYCHHGVRSLQAVAFLRKHGVRRAWSLAGGIDRWSEEVDPSLPRY